MNERLETKIGEMSYLICEIAKMENQEGELVYKLDRVREKLTEQRLRFQHLIIELRVILNEE